MTLLCANSMDLVQEAAYNHYCIALTKVRQDLQYKSLIFWLHKSVSRLTVRILNIFKKFQIRSFEIINSYITICDDTRCPRQAEIVFDDASTTMSQRSHVHEPGQRLMSPPRSHYFKSRHLRHHSPLFKISNAFSSWFDKRFTSILVTIILVCKE